MSWSGIIKGACSLLIATSAFEADNNIGWIDTDVIDNTACRWSGVFVPGPVGIARGTFGSMEVTWSLVFQTWLRGSADFTQWQDDYKITMQDVADAFKGDDTLGGSCDDVAISMIDVSIEQRGNRQYDVMTWLLEATEYGQ